MMLFVLLVAVVPGLTPDALARAELAKYCRAITGEEPPPCRFEIDSTLDAVHDEYRIVSDGAGARFVGANGRAVQYAVYDFLSRRGGCRWFWDGDVVPKGTLDFSGLDIREKSKFELRGTRYFAHRGLTRFQAEQWGLDDWKKEIDWCVKNRLNLFFPRIGQDDMFQKAFPDVVPYPDASRPLPGTGKGYANRSLFWPLEFRGNLRKAFTDYAASRGLIQPTDFGTMTHWYSPTPPEFLGKLKPDFITQSNRQYLNPETLVWDIRQKKWQDAYWQLTQGYIDAGYGTGEWLHTIGLGERMVYSNRVENLAYKKQVIHTLFDGALQHYPKAKLLLAGWDFWSTWQPDEVRDLITTLDPKNTVILDYEADTPLDNNFTNWGLREKFPYTFGIFLAYESSLDVRANYDLIVRRQREIENDPMCVGYVLWPESSHTDGFALRYFCENAWEGGKTDVPALLKGFCRDRYGDQAALFEEAWTKVIPMASIDGWEWNYIKWLEYGFPRFEDLFIYEKDRFDPRLDVAPAALRTLAKVDWNGDFVRRDAIDLARTVGDRLLDGMRRQLIFTWNRWRKGEAREGAKLAPIAKAYVDFHDAFVDLLALHTDYSLKESLDRLNEIEPVRNPEFEHVLAENAGDFYCRAHQYEFANRWYRRAVRDYAEAFSRGYATGDRTLPDGKDLERRYNSYHQDCLTVPLAEMAPTLPRTPANYHAVVGRMVKAAEAFFVAKSRAVDVKLAADAEAGWRIADAVTAEDGVETHSIALSRAGDAAVPPVVEIAFDIPVAGTSHYWQPTEKGNALFGSSEMSKFCFGTPVRAFVDDGDRSRLTMAWSECVRKVACSQRIVHEKPGEFFFHVTLKVFTEAEAPLKDWKMKMRLDSRDMQWSDAVREASQWVRNEQSARELPSPEAAYGGVYSTWYAFNRAFDEKILERECAEAAKLGMKALITDDGWQTTHGDWEPAPEKFADMRAHVERVHELGLKYVLWYAISFMNELSCHYPEFKGKYLADCPFWEHRLGILDPRFPEVRKFLSDQLADRLVKWNLDGYKIDFVDFFRTYGANVYDSAGGPDPAAKENYCGRDYRSIPEAAEALIAEISQRLRTVRPDVLLEFRQPYAGPVTARYGNMVRANDCPGDPLVNRVRTTDLRLATGAAVVHSDMLKWTPSADRADAARSILSVIFTTVQYSMVLDTIPPPQKDEIRKWIAFADAHRDALQKGGFRAYRPGMNYPLLEGWSDAERIFAVYEPNLAIDLPEDGRRIIVINATPSDRVTVRDANGVRDVLIEPYSFLAL